MKRKELGGMTLRSAKMILFVLSAIALLTTSFATAGIRPHDASSPTTIYIDSPATVRLGEDFTVIIRIADVVNLWAWQVKLQWDPALIEFVDVADGGFLLTGGPANSYFTPYSSGSVLIGSNLATLNNVGVGGNGILANVTLHCIGLGVSGLNLLQTRLFNDTQSIPWNGYGDADANGKIDMKDLFIVASAYASNIGDSGYNASADFNADGHVDLFDIMCSSVNFMKVFPDPILLPIEPYYITIDGLSEQIPEFPVIWRWVVNGSIDVWYIAYVRVDGSSPVENVSYTQPSDYLEFNISSSDPGYCNVTVPKLFMSGALQVLLNDTLVLSMTTWTRTKTSIYFTYDQGTYNVKIKGEIVAKMRGLWTLSDVNGDGKVNILDITRVAIDFGWHEP